MRKLFLAWVLAVGLACWPMSSQARQMIQNKGSDTLVNVAQAWAERYQKVKPDVAIAVSGGGTGTGIAALINGTVDIANASRSIEDKEKMQAKKRGVEPVEYVVGFDAVAVFVHKNNPLDHISLAQLAEIYGEDGKTENWSQLGVTVPGCQKQEIILVSRQNNSGTYTYFRDMVMGGKRDYKLGTRDMHGSKDVVDLVMHTPCAIGYSGLAYSTSEVKMLKVSQAAGSAAVYPTVTSAVDKTYPIARPLLMYTNGKARDDIKNYLGWILSDEGQCVIFKKGYAAVRHVTCN